MEMTNAHGVQLRVGTKPPRDSGLAISYNVSVATYRSESSPPGFAESFSHYFS
jgi:hypothetical protein